MKNNKIANLAEKVINEYKEYSKNDCEYFDFFIENSGSKIMDNLLENGNIETINKISNYIDEHYDIIDIVTYDKEKEINTISLEEILSMLNDESNDYYYFIKGNKIYYGYQKWYSKICKK